MTRARDRASGANLTSLGITATTAQLNKMATVTASASDLNKMDGMTSTKTELQLLTGKTALGHVDGSNPNFGNMIGQIGAFGQSTAPTGWLICDGSTINGVAGGLYANLWSKIGTTYGGSGQTSFILPDLRGEFCRGFDDGRGIDSGRAIASAQTDTLKQSWYGDTRFQAHYHTGGWGSGNCNWQIKHSGYPNNYGANETTNAFIAPWYQISNGIGYNSMRLKVGESSETRVRNVAVRYCIKY